MLLMHRILRICSVIGGAPCSTSRDEGLLNGLGQLLAPRSWAVRCSQNDRPGSFPEETSPLRNDPEYPDIHCIRISFVQSGILGASPRAPRLFSPRAFLVP